MAHILRYDEGLRYDSGLRYDQVVPDTPPKQKGRKLMGTNFIPRPRGEYRDWLQNLSDKIATIGPTLGLAPADVTAIQTTCAGQIARIDALTPAETTLQGLQEAEADGRVQTDATLREEIADWKRLDTWTNQIAADLNVISPTTAFDPDTYKPEFKLGLVAGEIRLDWKKKGADGVAIYARLAGQTTWTRIGIDTSSPYIDGRPLAQAGVPETREYMLRGMLKDEEIGLDSDIGRIAWAGA